MNTQTVHPVTVDGIGYWIDKDAEIKVDNKININNKIFTTSQRPDGVPFIGYYNPDWCYISKDCSKVIACEFPHKIEGLHQFKLPDEVDVLANEYTKNETDNNLRLISKYSFKDGYKANKAKWTDEEAKLMFQLGREFEISGSIEDSFDAACDALGSLHKNNNDGLLIISKINYKMKTITLNGKEYLLVCIGLFTWNASFPTHFTINTKFIGKISTPIFTPGFDDENGTGELITNSKIIGLVSDILKDENICKGLVECTDKNFTGYYKNWFMNYMTQLFVKPTATESFLSYLQSIDLDLTKSWLLIQKL